MIKIQLVDDEVNVLKALKRLLTREGIDVHTFTAIDDALSALSEHQYCVIVVDYQMPQINGVTYLQFARQSQPDAVRMVLSAHGDRHALMDAINLAEIYRFVSKPWDDAEIVAAVRAGIDLYRLRLENRRLLRKLELQQTRLMAQREELQRLERENPGLTRVERDNDGNIIVNDSTDHTQAAV